VTAPFRPGRRIACLAVLAALPLTACAAGYQAETSRERTTLTSVSGARGELTLRNVFLVGPADSGASLPLYLAAFNGGNLADKLVSITSPSASGSYVPSDSSIAGGGSLFYNAGDPVVPQLTGLKQKVLVGQTISVTMDFQVAGEITLTVPVESSTLPSPSPVPSASASPAASASPTASASASPSASATP